MEVDNERGAGGAWSPIDVDKVMVWRCPPLSMVSRWLARDPPGIESRPDGLQIPTWQPPWCYIVHGIRAFSKKGSARIRPSDFTAVAHGINVMATGIATLF
jgi:hypothetical protein